MNCFILRNSLQEKRKDAVLLKIQYLARKKKEKGLQAALFTA